jgi:hypothetical protein
MKPADFFAMPTRRNGRRHGFLCLAIILLIIACFSLLGFLGDPALDTNLLIGEFHGRNENHRARIGKRDYIFHRGVTGWINGKYYHECSLEALELPLSTTTGKVRVEIDYPLNKENHLIADRDRSTRAWSDLGSQ